MPKYAMILDACFVERETETAQFLAT